MRIRTRSKSATNAQTPHNRLLMKTQRCWQRNWTAFQSSSPGEGFCKLWIQEFLLGEFMMHCFFVFNLRNRNFFFVFVCGFWMPGLASSFWRSRIFNMLSMPREKMRWTSAESCRLSSYKWQVVGLCFGNLQRYYLTPEEGARGQMLSRSWANQNPACVSMWPPSGAVHRLDGGLHDTAGRTEKQSHPTAWCFPLQRCPRVPSVSSSWHGDSRERSLNQKASEPSDHLSSWYGILW